MRNYGTAYTRALVIVHGKSEYTIMRHIKSKLRIPIEIYAKNGGERSIEILSVMQILNSSIFKTKKAFLKEYPKIEVDKKVNPVRFKVFIVVDVDFNQQADVDRYMDKTMFRNHWLCDYIVPVLNDNNLEEVLNDLGFTAAKKDKEKKKYKQIFPVERGKQDLDTVQSLQEAFRDSRKSNFIELLDYCMDNCPNFESS